MSNQEQAMDHELNVEELEQINAGGRRDDERLLAHLRERWNNAQDDGGRAERR